MQFLTAPMKKTVVKNNNTPTVKPHFMDTRLIWTPYYFGLFSLSLGKESTCIFPKFNPLNTDTPLIWTLSLAPCQCLH